MPFFIYGRLREKLLKERLRGDNRSTGTARVVAVVELRVWPTARPWEARYVDG